MNILHVITSVSSQFGGPSKACREMCRELVTLGEQVAIYTTNIDVNGGFLDVPLQEPLEENGYHITYFPAYNWGNTISFPMALTLRKQLPQFDIVHIHSLYLWHTAVTAHYCRKYHIPYLIRPHGTLDPYLRQRHSWRKRIYTTLIERRNLDHAAAIHYTTEEEMRLAADCGFQAPGIVVPNGLRLKDYQQLPEKGEFAESYPETRGKQILLFLGRINFKKGLDILAKAYGKVAQKNCDAHLVITGPDNDNYGRQVRQWLSAEGVLERTTFTGMLEGRAKLTAFRDADLFVLPSYTENFGIAVIEAMACEIPVIISDKVNIWREVESNQAGKVLPCDANRFADTILALLDQPELAKQMGRHGKALVQDQFQWEKVAIKLQNVYQSLL